MNQVTITCPCPRTKDGGVRHPGGDTVELRDNLDFRAGMTARNAVQLARADDPDLSSAEILTILTEIYVLQGVEAWSLVGEDGKRLPVTRPYIREYLLADVTTALLVGDAADDQYAEAVMLPLLEPGSTSSPSTPTEPSTSATTGSEQLPPTRSKRSSTSTTPTVVIEGTSRSRDGVSSSLPS